MSLLNSETVVNPPCCR